MARKTRSRDLSDLNDGVSSTLSIDGQRIPPGQEEAAVADLIRAGRSEATSGPSHVPDPVRPAGMPLDPPETLQEAARALGVPPRGEMDAEDYLALLREIESLDGRINETSADLDRLGEAAKAAHEAAGDKKKAYEGMRAELLDLVRRRRKLIAGEDTPGPLFRRKAEPEPTTNGHLADVALAAAASGDSSWRGVELADLDGIPDTVLEALAECDLLTVGDLADWTANGHFLTDVPGIGPAKAEQIDQALARFWAARQAGQPSRPGGPWPATVAAAALASDGEVE